MHRRSLLGTALAACALLATASGQDEQDPLIGKPAPPLNAEGKWLNWKGDLSFDKLRGHVVYVEFTFIH